MWVGASAPTLSDQLHISKASGLKPGPDMSCWFTVTIAAASCRTPKECYCIVIAGDVGLKMPAAYSICA